MIGYHHVLMMVIAVAIILLCKLPDRLTVDSTCVIGMRLTIDSSIAGWMFFIVSTNP